MDVYPFGNDDQELSSGCESGWTLYLDQSSNNSISGSQQSGGFLHARTRSRRVFSKRMKREDHRKEEEERTYSEEDEDLSMVSDASSGPPHFHEEDIHGGCCCLRHYTAARDPAVLLSRHSRSRENAEQNLVRAKVDEDRSSLLDDTASSHFFDFSNKSFVPTRSSSPRPSMENVLEYSQGYSTTHSQVV